MLERCFAKSDLDNSVVWMDFKKDLAMEQHTLKNVNNM